MTVTPWHLLAHARRTSRTALTAPGAGAARRRSRHVVNLITTRRLFECTVRIGGHCGAGEICVNQRALRPPVGASIADGIGNAYGGDMWFRHPDPQARLWKRR
jgi:hypothetical protein